VAKRLFDVVVAAAALILLSPLIGLVALLVLLRLGRPVFFRQLRPGMDGRPFRLVKFRTMIDAPSGADGPATDAQRLTGLGRFLRASSLDELPELWNVLRGHMSLVGPRPLLMQYLPLYSPEQARRHRVRPGLTGWAQVNGRNALSWEEKFALDNYYVDNRSFGLDLRILALTIVHVIRPRGISAEGEATMAEFTGSRHPVSEGAGSRYSGAEPEDAGSSVGRRNE
jgi:lipopolysaccharide/colanic/teichoic acid biosynthesis glycosyltransferase